MARPLDGAPDGGRHRGRDRRPQSRDHAEAEVPRRLPRARRPPPHAGQRVPAAAPAGADRRGVPGAGHGLPLADDEGREAHIHQPARERRHLGADERHLHPLPAGRIRGRRDGGRVPEARGAAAERPERAARARAGRPADG